MDRTICLFGGLVRHGHVGEGVRSALLLKALVEQLELRLRRGARSGRRAQHTEGIVHLQKLLFGTLEPLLATRTVREVGLQLPSSFFLECTIQIGVQLCQITMHCLFLLVIDGYRP